MMRAVMVVGALLLGVSAVVAQQDVAVQQDNLMKGQGGALYGKIGRMVRGDVPYDQATVDAALGQLGDSVGKIAATFATNSKEEIPNAAFGASPKIWDSKADFDAKIPPVAKAIADAKDSAKDAATLKVAYGSINEKCGGCHETYRVKLK